MAKIKVGELKDLKKEFCKDIEIVDFHGLDIEIKQYLPVEDKIALIMKAHISAIDEEESFDYYIFDIGFRKLLIENYTNLTLPKSVFDAFDLITETGLYDFIYQHIPEKEIQELMEFKNKYMKTEEENRKRRNTIQYIIKQIMGDFIDKLPDKEETEKFIDAVYKEANKNKNSVKSMKKGKK